MKPAQVRTWNLAGSTLSVAVSLALFPAAAPAQVPAAGNAPRVETLQITGSRVSRAESETALPVTVLTKEDIQATGQVTIAEVLRTITFNTQGSSIPVVGSTGQGATDVNLRGLGFGRTLVLINGRRVPVDSNFFGFAASTTFVPYGAIERIEILREGASAVYGSDALGGVVNIILRTDYQGAEGLVQYTDPVGEGGVTQVYGVTGGMSTRNGGFVIAAEHRKADFIRRRDREYMRSDYSNLGFGFLSNSFPPTYRVTDFFGNGSNVAGPLTAAPGCGAGLTRTTPGLSLTNPPTGARVTTGSQTECRNPTADATDFAPEFEVDSLYASGRWSFTNSLSAFAEALYSKQDSVGRSAPVVTARTLSATNPNNPTRNATVANPIGGVTAPRAVAAQIALPDSLQRTLTSESTYRNFVAGLDWKPVAGDLSLYFQKAKQSADNDYYNALRTAAFNAAVDSGALNPFDTTRPGDFAAYVTTGTRYTESKLDSAGLNWSAAIPGFQAPGGAIRYVLGYESRKESLIETCDALTGAFALNGAFCFARPLAERTIKAFFGELVVPVTKTLEASYAGRRDDYSVPDFTRGTNRLALRFQVLPVLALRGGISEGVRAPNLFEISSASGTATTNVIDTRRCSQAGGSPSNPACQPIAITQTIKGGPDLRPEDSRSDSIGAVWSPHRSFNISLDYYKVRVEDQIANLSNQAVVDLEALGFDLTQYSVSVTRGANGLITAVTSGSANVPGFSTSGYDIEASYARDLKEWGKYNSRFVMTWVRDFKRSAVPGAAAFDAVGFVNQPQKLFNWSHKLNWRSWTADLRWNYIGGFDARSPEGTFILNQPDPGRIGAYQTFDMAVTYATPWKGRITVGARNITDRLPTLSRFAFGEFGYSRALHDVNGRVLTLSYAQTFR